MNNDKIGIKIHMINNICERDNHSTNTFYFLFILNSRQFRKWLEKWTWEDGVS